MSSMAWPAALNRSSAVANMFEVRLRWIFRVGALLMASVATWLLLHTSAEVAENPADAADTSGISSLAMYVVILLMLMGISLGCMILGGVVEIYLGASSRDWRRAGSCLSVTALVFSCMIGGMVAFAYGDQAPLAYGAMTVYLSSLAVLLYDWIISLRGRS